MPEDQLMERFEDYLLQQIFLLQPGRVRDAMEYALMGSGKRVRPRLLFAVLQAYGQNPETGFAPAAAIEMIHTYSLIHDDLPAMDNDDLRRGRPSTHKAFDEATAILAGDALLTQAFGMLFQTPADPAVLGEMSQLLCDYAGVNGMIYGQELDIKAEQDDQVDLSEIEIYKTGKLLSLPLLFGALLADGRQDLDTWKEAGALLGKEFQIQDDLLDVLKSAEELGKSNSDEANGKLTYVSRMGIEPARKEVIRLHQNILDLLEGLDIQPASLQQQMDFLLHRQY